MLLFGCTCIICSELHGLWPEQHDGTSQVFAICFTIPKKGKFCPNKRIASIKINRSSRLLVCLFTDLFMRGWVFALTYTTFMKAWVYCEFGDL